MFPITNTPTKVSSYKIKNSVIVLLEYFSRYELCSTFMRCQEFYESEDTRINGHIFTIETFMDAYAERFGSFSYTMDWSGFNIPSDCFLHFFETFSDLLIKEKTLHSTVLNELAKYNDPTSFYVIGSYKECPNQSGVIEHELAHSLFKLDKTYRTKMTDFVNKFLFKSDLFYTLKTEWGYSKAVLIDEAHAYMATNNMDEWNEFSKIKLNKKNGFNDYSSGYMDDMRNYFLLTINKYNIQLPNMNTLEEIHSLETKLRKKYGYNAGENFI